MQLNYNQKQDVTVLTIRNSKIHKISETHSQIYFDSNDEKDMLHTFQVNEQERADIINQKLSLDAYDFERENIVYEKNMEYAADCEGM